MNYAEREFGYQLTVLDRSSIETYYSDGSELLDSDARIYTCTVKVPEFVEPGLDPLPSYYERCLEGASEWGEEFLRDFKKTTYASGGNLLDFNPQK